MGKVIGIEQGKVIKIRKELEQEALIKAFVNRAKEASRERHPSGRDTHVSNETERNEYEGWDWDGDEEHD